MRHIVTYGEDVLKQSAAVIPDINQVIKNLADEMLDAMYRGRGIGLAGPQIGESKRIFVCHIDGDEARVFINPSIVQTGLKEVNIEEGCLSVPGVYADVKRPANVRVQAWNEKGKPFTLDADGLLGRVILHEIDHLNGTLFIDHLTEKKRERLLKHYQKRAMKQEY